VEIEHKRRTDPDTRVPVAEPERLAAKGACREVAFAGAGTDSSSPLQPSSAHLLGQSRACGGMDHSQRPSG
jgi:hypothetical protein